MNTVNKILEDIEDDIKTLKSFHSEEVYDGEGNRDFFQEGHNHGYLNALETLVHKIRKSANQ
jgi:hypothetical protein